MLLVFLKGLGVGAGLIIAIGSQNAFVLTQGIKKEYWIIIPLICFICDAVLIILGVAGMGGLVSSNPGLIRYTAWGGAIFLFWYGFIALRSAFKRGSLDESRINVATLKATIITTLALTLLNPHVYLDTVVLIGSIGSQFLHEQKIFFASGAILASLIWFFLLSLGGSLLGPLFKKNISWKILDTLVCITMWSIGGSLIL